MSLIQRIFLLSLGMLLVACAASMQSTVDHPALDSQAKWVVLPLANNTDTPQASLSAEAMIEHQLRLRGISSLASYPTSLSRDSLFEPTERKISEEAQKWAREQGYRYAVSGSVEEWRYKVGIDGEPAAGVTLKITDLPTGQVVWSAAGAKSGWSRQALSAVAQAVMSDLVSTLKLNTGKESK